MQDRSRSALRSRLASDSFFYFWSGPEEASTVVKITFLMQEELAFARPSSPPTEASLLKPNSEYRSGAEHFFLGQAVAFFIESFEMNLEEKLFISNTFSDTCSS